jgi:hypothetical protein
MNPSLTVGTRRDPLGISAWRSIAHRIVISSRVPVHSVLVQKSVTTITNAVGRLSTLDARQSWPDAQDAPWKKMAIGLPREISGCAACEKKLEKSDLVVHRSFFA